MFIFNICLSLGAASLKIHHHIYRFSYQIEPTPVENAFSEGFPSWIYFCCNW